MQTLRINNTVFILVALFFFSSMPESGFAAPSDEIANVDGASISTELFEKRMSRLTREGQGDFTSLEMKQELLDMLIATEVLHQEGKRRGLLKNPEVMSQIKEFTESLLVREMVNMIRKDRTTNTAMKDFYVKKQADFGEVRANHILVKTEQEALDVKKKLGEGGDFAALAKEVSNDPASAARGGDLGFFTKDRMVKPFSDAAFAMKKGEISSPVKSPFGYHIIQMLEMRAPGAFETLTPAQLQNIQGMLINDEIDQLKAKAKVRVNEDALKKASPPSPPKMSMPGMGH